MEPAPGPDTMGMPCCHATAVLWLAIAVTAGGCDVPVAAPPTAGDADGANADSSADASSAPQVRVGGADELGEGFVDWSQGVADAPILRGPQGGQHIWVSALTRNLWPKKARVAVTLYVEATGVADQMVKPGRVEVTGTLKSSDEAGWLIYAGLPAFVKEPCKIMDKRVRVELEVSDLYAVKAKDKAWITPKWDGHCEPEDGAP